MGYKINFTETFSKSFGKLTKIERDRIEKKLEILVINPFHPSLRTKKLKGHDGKFEFSVNMDIRVIWEYRGDTILLMLDVGHHGILDRY
ncbi:MAG: cytotoxin [Lactobacillales bacterium]|jgi:mRNA-degrading endonuclease RelE of RelBE toxin-antitoxin system|nr:cytotoxin [Lactobacillales bacterium]